MSNLHSVVHMCPPQGSGVMPCCGLTPFQVSRLDRMTEHAALVTCSIMSDSPYKEFRKDGWPFCPRCEEDELVSAVGLAYCGECEPPTLEEHLASGMRCLYCNWTNDRYLLIARLDPLQQ